MSKIFKVKVFYENAKSYEYDVEYPKAYINRIIDQQNELENGPEIESIYLEDTLKAEKLGSKLVKVPQKTNRDMSKVRKAIILAAGKSTRYGSNKLIDPILGKSTVQYCIEFCIENGIEDAYVTISKSDFFFKNRNTKLSHPIIESLSKYKKDINIFYEFQKENEYGPGAAIKTWEGAFYEPFLCLFGDNFYKGNIGLEYHDPNTSVVTYKDYETRARNLQLATIVEDVVIEKPHGLVNGRYFCGYMIFSKEAFDNLDSIKMSNRNEYEITHLINSMDNLKFQELNICWYDLTYEQDKKVIEEILQTC